MPRCTHRSDIRELLEQLSDGAVICFHQPVAALDRVQKLALLCLQRCQHGAMFRRWH
jgi:hypothetical protein